MTPSTGKWAVLSLAALFLSFYGGPARATAENRALELNLATQGNRTRCVIQLDSSPAYSVKALGEDGVEIVLRDTVRTEPFMASVAKDGSAAVTDPDTAAPDLGLRLKLPAPLDELSAAWVPASGALYLDMIHGKAGRDAPRPAPKATALKGIHFGFMDMRTRMVLGLDERVPWELSQTTGNRIRLSLPTVSEDLDHDQYGPVENLAQATLVKAGDGTDIAVRLLSRIDRVRLFWTKGGARLVADLFEGSPMEDAAEDAPETAALKDIPSPDSAPGGEPASKAHWQDSLNGKKQEAASETGEPPLESSGPVVRGRIVRGEGGTGSTSSGSPSETAAAGDAGGLSEEDLLRELDPAEVLLYGQIRQADREKDAEQLAELCGTFLEQFPGSPMEEKVCFLECDALFDLVQSGDKGRFTAMMKSCQNALSTYRNSPRVHDAHFNMARASSLVGNDYAAIGYLNMIIHGAPDQETSARAYLERGRVYLKVNQPGKAVKDFQTTLKEAPASPLALEARVGTARYFQTVGLHDRAEEELAGLIEEHPRFYLDHPEVIFLRGTSALYLKHYDKAREFFFRALNIGGQPEGSDLLLAKIGDTYHHASMPREAESVYRTVIREFPDSDGAAIAKLRLAGYESGYDGFQALREENPDKPVADLAALEMARKLYEEGRFAMALPPLKELMDKPFKSDIQREAARLYFRAVEQEMKRLHKEGDAGTLIDFYRPRRAELHRNIDPETTLLAGLAFHQLEQYPEAVAVLEGIKPYDLNQVSKGQRVLALVDSLLKLGKEDRALEFLEEKKGRALLPAADRQKMDLLLAGMYRDRGRDREAFALYEGLVNGERLLADRDIASAYLAMGRIAAREGHFEQARTSLNRCIALVEKSEEDRPMLYQAYAELGNAYYLGGQYGNALDAFKKAIDQGFSADDKGFWEMRFLMAQSYLEMGDYNLAEPILIEISEQGDGLLQKRVRIRLGQLGLEKQLQRLSISR
jgi:tetratricopeptide (TPR) repeat protein